MLSTSAVAVPPRGYGGTEQVVYDLTEGLVADGHDVTLFATGDSRASARVRHFFGRPVWPVDDLAEATHAAWACAEIARERFDVVHAHQPISVALSPLLRAPLVYTIHHDQRARYSDLYRRFPGVHYVSISGGQRARERGLPNARVIHHGVDPARFPLHEDPEDYVAFIGRFAPEKAPHLAIDAARRARVPIRLAGVPHPGEGEEYHAREIVPRLRARGVTWLGEVGADRKGAFLGRARAMLLPICWEEPFGLVTVESLLSGTPVIAFARGAAPEIIEDGVTGMLVRDVAEMARAIPRAMALDRTRVRARALERFRAQRMVRDYERLYRAVVAGAGRSGAATRATAARQMNAAGGSADKRRRRGRQGGARMETPAADARLRRTRDRRRSRRSRTPGNG